MRTSVHPSVATPIHLKISGQQTQSDTVLYLLEAILLLTGKNGMIYDAGNCLFRVHQFHDRNFRTQTMMCCVLFGGCAIDDANTLEGKRRPLLAAKKEAPAKIMVQKKRVSSS